MTVAPFPGIMVPAVEVFGQTVDVWAQPVADELKRRAALGAGPLLDGDLLRTLMEVPADIPILTRSLDPLVREALTETGVAIGAVAELGPYVLRLRVAPVALMGLVKHARDWGDVQAITLLRTHAPRLLVTDHWPLAHRALRETNPDLGVAYRIGAHIDVLRAPGRRWLRPSWQRWLLAETTYAHTGWATTAPPVT